jgi:hypothetical protein
MSETPPEPKYGAIDTTPVPEAPPPMPPPSPTVQPFESGGGPPPPEKIKRKRSFAGQLALILPVVLLATLATFVYYTYGDQIKSLVGIKPAATATPLAPDYGAGLSSSLKNIDSSINDVETNLSDSNSASTDKAGDLSE